MSLERHRAESSASLRFAVVTISDTRDARSDRGGPLLAERLTAAGHRVTFREIAKDEAEAITDVVRRAVAAEDVDLVLTTGGTGIAPRDVTYPTLTALFDSQIPGFGELFRMLSYEDIGSAALLSRALAGLRGGKVVFVIPGSRGAVRLAMEKLILPELGHLAGEARKTR